MPDTARQITFSGRVQGVGFRFTALNMASRYQLTGYVRNLPDGTVEMLAQGDSDDINECIRDIQDSFSGYVKDTEIQQVPADPRCNDFKITF